MKDITIYINETLSKRESKITFSKTQIEQIAELREKHDIFGEIPDKIAKIICKFYFRNLENDKNVTIFFDNENKTIFFKNLKYIESTIDRYLKLFNEGYKLVFNENSEIGIRSGMSKEQSRGWPATWYDPFIKILKNISDSNSERKFTKLSLNRFDCSYFSNKIGKAIYVDCINFNECIYETDMRLPTDEDKKSWKNPNMKFTSTSKRAKTYYAENGMLAGSEEEVKSHWTKSFAKEWQEKQEQEQKRLNLIKPTHENPPSIYSGELRGEPGIYIEYSSSKQNAFLSIVFPSNFSNNSYENWWKSNKIVSVKGAYIKVDGTIWEITKSECEGGYWTSGRTIHDFWLKKVK